MFETYDWESQSASAVQHLWLTSCDSTASSLHATANPAGQDKRLNIEYRSLRQTRWRTLSGERMDPTVERARGRRPEIINDRCLWVDKAVMLGEPWTKTKVGQDIHDRLKKLLEKNAMDFTQTDSMKFPEKR